MSERFIWKWFNKKTQQTKKHNIQIAKSDEPMCILYRYNIFVDQSLHVQNDNLHLGDQHTEQAKYWTEEILIDLKPGHIFHHKC